MGYGSPRLWNPPPIGSAIGSLERPGHSTTPKKYGFVRNDGSDVKAPWELSRLQWSSVVARAFVLTGDKKYREALHSSLTDWIVANPLGKGVNWTVAMEAALRGISLCLTMELLWPFTPEEKPWLDQLTASLWQHLRFIEAHSEFSFLVRSNHYLSNIVGLTTFVRLSSWTRDAAAAAKKCSGGPAGDSAADVCRRRRWRGVHRLPRSCGANVSAFVGGAAGHVVS